ncbi:hypothetical protein Emed_002880 [Eimeria media]
MAAPPEAEGSPFELPLSSAASLCGTQEGTCLHDGGGATPSEGQPQLVYERSLQPASDGLLSVTALACSPDGSRVGVATKDRLLHLIGGPANTDEVFPARPAEKDKPCQLVTGLAFNHDGSLLAVSQSDGVTHVYPTKQQEARRICRRLPVGCPATCLAWAVEERRLLFIGLLNGKVRVADVEANKLGALHESHSPVTSLACTADGLLVASGHRNGQVLLHNLQPGAPHPALVTLTQLAAPVASIQLREEGVACAAGDKIILLTRAGAKLRELSGVSLPALIAWHPTAPWLAAASGENVWLLSTSVPLVDGEAGSSKECSWSPVSQLVFEGLVCVTAIAWEKEGFSLCFGSARGSVERLLAFHQHLRADDAHILVSLCNTLLARPLQAEACCRVLHRSEEKIERLDVQRPLLRESNAGQLALAWTARGFLAASLASGKRYQLAGSVGEELRWLGEVDGTCLLHEPPSHKDGQEARLSLAGLVRGVALQASSGDERGGYIHVIRENARETVRLPTTSPASSDFISLLHSQPQGLLIAYLIDRTTIRVSSIPTGEQKSLFQSELPVRWLGLGDSVLVLLDGEGKLRSVPLEEVTREQQHRDCVLLRACKKAAFLGSEALLVAQKEHTLCIWYNVEAPEVLDAFQVEGVLLRLEESSQASKTKEEKDLAVVTRKAFGVEERHPLCPIRRGFERCLRLENYEEAVTLLSKLPESRTTTKLWRRLGARALDEEFLSTCLQGSDAISPACMQRVAVAAWAAASAGEAADAWFLRKMLKTQALLGDSNESARNAVHLKAGLAAFKGNFSAAENLLMQRGEVEAVVQMYRQLYRWTDCVRVLEQFDKKQAEETSKEHHAEAGDVLLARGQVESAAEQYLLGRLPAKAADLIIKTLPPAKLSAESPLEEAGEEGNAEAPEKGKDNTCGSFSSDFIASVADALLEIELPARAADLLAHVGSWRRSLSLYDSSLLLLPLPSATAAKCCDYAKAVEIAEAVAPDQLPALHEKWAKASMLQGSVEDGIAHLVKAGRGAEAVKVCTEARLWKQALHLLKERKDAEALKTLLSVGEQLEQQGDLAEAEDAYVHAQALDRAVKMRFDLLLLSSPSCCPTERVLVAAAVAAMKLARTDPRSEKLRAFMQQRAQELAAEGNFKDAEAVLLAIRDVQGALQLLHTHRQFERLLLLIDSLPGDRDTICMRLAARLSVEGNSADAERLFLVSALDTELCGFPFLQQQENQRLLQHISACGAWQEAVDMHAAAGDWAAAERVALSSGGQDARRRVWLRRAQQLLKSEGPEAAVQLLHGEAAAAVKLAVEASAFEVALEVTKAHCPEETKDVYLQLARQKEAAGETAAAEEAYLQAGAPAAAIALYKKRGQWEDALRLAREHRPSELQPLLMQQAKAKVAAEDLEGAQGVLLEAGRSDLAVQLLVRKSKWAAAIRLAGEKARPMLAQVLQQQQQQSSVKTLHELKDLCEALEGVGAIQRAVDLCLATDDVQTGDPLELRHFWLHAQQFLLQCSQTLCPLQVDLAQRAEDPSLRERAAATAAKKLQQAGDLASAGQVLLSAGRGHEALQAGRRQQVLAASCYRTTCCLMLLPCYVSAQDWKSASALASSLGPAAEAELARHRRMQLKTIGDVEGLLHAGEVDTALSLLAEANEWPRCLDIAAERRHPMLAQLLKRRVDALLEANSPAEAAEALGTYGALQAEVVRPLCERVASALKAQHLQQQISKQSASQGKEEDKLCSEDSSSDCSPFRITRQMYIRLLTGRESTTAPPLNALPWFSSWGAQQANAAEQLLLQAHFECTTAECGSISGLEQLSAKAALSVMRYSAGSPCIDWLYYRAGMQCRRAGWTSTAQWILNRYLDLCEFIDDPSQTEIDFQPFREFGLPVPDLNSLPKAHSVPSVQQEQARDLVLWWSVDASAKPQVPTRNCAGCGEALCMWALACSKCNKKEELCCVSGFPVPQDSRSCCSACGSPASAADLNIYARHFHRCPWCHSPMEQSSL